MNAGAVDLDPDLVFEVAGEDRIDPAKQHHCDNGPRDS
jgi:hypothetical protein